MKLYLDGELPENGEKRIPELPQKIKKIEKVTETLNSVFN